MKKTDIMGIAFGNFWRRKTRSLLSVLGVVIGTASIVCMMSLGVAMKYNTEEQMKRYGNMNQIQVYAGYDEKTGKQKELDEETLAQISAIENVKAYTPIMDLSGRLFSGKYRAYGQIIGIDISYLEALGSVPEQGRLLTSEDSISGKTIPCIMGRSLVYQFEKPRKAVRMGYNSYMMVSTDDGPEGVPEGGYYYNGKIFDENGKQVGTYPPAVDVMDENTRVKYTYDWSYGERPSGDTSSMRKKADLYTMKTVGILGEEGSDFSYSLILDLSAAKKIEKDQLKWENSQNPGGTKQKPREAYSQAYVLSDSLEHTMEVVAAIKAMGLEAYSNADWIQQQQETQNIMQMVLAGIGFVSLLVAAIGIANTMIMSIYERTREIGIMKVIGCFLKDIRAMFLTEAAFIGLFGGLAGVALSYGISAVMNLLAGGGGLEFFGMSMGGGDGASKMSVIPPWLALAAVLFAVFIALLSGFFPARRAMKLSALTAMQN